MKKLFVVAILLFSLFTLQIQAQVKTDISLKNVLDGKQVTLKDYSSSPGIVIIFTSVSCPFDGYYTNRLKQLQSNYGAKVPILLVNAYTEAPEAEDWMLKTAQANGLTMPYLSDKNQVLMTQLGAQRSPEVFLLKNNNGELSVIYQGAIDDNAQAETGVKQFYLKDAIESLLANTAMKQATTRTVGCYIRKK